MSRSGDERMCSDQPSPHPPRLFWEAVVGRIFELPLHQWAQRERTII